MWASADIIVKTGERQGVQFKQQSSILTQRPDTTGVWGTTQAEVTYLEPFQNFKVNNIFQKVELLLPISLSPSLPPPPHTQSNE